MNIEDVIGLAMLLALWFWFCWTVYQYRKLWQYVEHSEQRVVELEKHLSQEVRRNGKSSESGKRSPTV